MGDLKHFWHGLWSNCIGSYFQGRQSCGGPGDRGQYFAKGADPSIGPTNN